MRCKGWKTKEIAKHTKEHFSHRRHIQYFNKSLEAAFPNRNLTEIFNAFRATCSWNPNEINVSTLDSSTDGKSASRDSCEMGSLISAQKKSDRISQQRLVLHDLVIKHRLPKDHKYTSPSSYCQIFLVTDLDHQCEIATKSWLPQLQHSRYWSQLFCNAENWIPCLQAWKQYPHLQWRL